MSQSDFVTRGQALVSSGQYQEAVKVCRLGLLGRPTTVEGRVVLGQALLALKRYDEVLAEMRVALELDHASVPAQALRGEALLRKGDGAGAVEVLARLRAQGLADSHTAALLAEAERLAGRSPPGNPGGGGGGGGAVGAINHRQALDAREFLAEQGTVNYAAQLGEPSADTGAFETAAQPGEFTQPTSLAAIGARKRGGPDPGLPADATPPPSVLAVGDRSGTVEVDPERDGLGLRLSEDDFGDAVGPPGPPNDFDIDAAATGVLEGARGSVSATFRSQKSPSSSATAPAAAKKSRRAPMRKEESSVELDDDDMIEVDEPSRPSRSSPSRSSPSRQGDPERTGRKLPGPGTAVRNAVKMPSGPIDLPPNAPAPLPQPRQTGPTIPSQQPPHLAQMLAGQPHVLNMAQPPLPQPAPINPRSAIAAALPTAAALPIPSAPGQGHGMGPGMGHGMGPGMGPSMNPGMGQGMGQGMGPGMGPSMNPGMGPGMNPGMNPGMGPMGQGMGPAIGPGMGFGQPGPGPGMPMHGMQPMQPAPHLAQTMLAQPAMAVHPSAAAAARPTIALDPRQQHSAAAVDAAFNGQDGWGRPGMPAGSPPFGAARAGADDSGRSAQELDPRMPQLSPGGGIPVLGFGEPSQVSQLSKSARSARPGRSRLIAVWLLISVLVIGGGVFAGFQIRAMRLRHQIEAARDAARDLAKADTWGAWIGARDALYSIAQASPTVDNRAAFARARGVLAFEFGDAAADARAAVDSLAGKSGLDLAIATAYVGLTQRDAKLAREAADRAVQDAPNDAAALYVSGQAQLLAGDVKAAIAALRSAVERETRPHYAIGLARALGEAAMWDDAIAALDKVRDNPGAVISRGVLLAGAGRITGGQGGEIRAQLTKLVGDQKPADLAPAQVALADLALARVDYARGEVGAAKADALASLNLGLDDQRFAEELTDTAIAIGQIDLARKAATRALDKWPTSRRIRLALAQIWIATGTPGAAVDLFAKAADLASSGPVGQTVRGQARLAAGDIDGARADFDAAIKKLPGYEPAVIARSWLDLAAGDADAARKRIEPKFNPKTATPGMVAIYAAVLRATGDAAARDKAKGLLERVVAGSRGPDTARAQLELARIDRDLGDFQSARSAYAEAARAGNFDARLESGALLIETSDPRGGRDTLDQLVKDAADHPSATLLLEAARARTLVGDHRGGLELIARAEKAPGVVRWQLDRERGRIALRKGDTAGAGHALARALDGCGGDLESFLLAADTLSADERQTELGQKLAALLPARLKGKPELDIIAGKLAIAANRFDDADKLYTAAHAALEREKASPRRRAQCDFGLGAVAYFRRQDASATSRLKLVLYEDPSIDAAYLFAAELERERDPDKALESAQAAVAYNPDSVDAWKMVGTIAAAQLPRQRKLLDEAITRVNDLAPGSEALRQLQKLK